MGHAHPPRLSYPYGRGGGGTGGGGLVGGFVGWLVGGGGPKPKNRIP